MTEKPERDDFLPKLRNALNGFSPTPVCWAVLSAGKEMNEQLGHLTDWVNWLVDRYALDHRTVPPCRDQHGAVLEELSALRTAWIGTPPGVRFGRSASHVAAHAVASAWSAASPLSRVRATRGRTTVKRT